MVSPTEALRLKQALQTVNHFASLEGIEAEEVEMTPEEAIHCLRSCIKSILGHPKVEVAVQFASFRKKLESYTFKETDNEIVSLASAPYFFASTTLSILLASLKTAHGAELEHAIGNINVVLPILWQSLRKPERWAAGQAYAEVFAAGKSIAAIGLKRALSGVGGFDYVPETLRSDTFSRAAHEVLKAHEGFNNFYNEPVPMQSLAALGSTIPMPAFPICIRATLVVRLGNAYGRSSGAQPAAKKMLDRLSENQWKYYLNDCLPTDLSILEKLAWFEPPRKAWIDLAQTYKLAEIKTGAGISKKLLDGILSGNTKDVKESAERLIERRGKR